MAGKISLAEYTYKVSVDGSKVQQDLKNIDTSATNSLSNISSKFSELNNKFKDNFSGLNKIADGFTSVGSKLTLGITTPLLGLATLCTKAASNLEQTNKKTQQVFGDMADNVNEWALENEKAFGLGSGTTAGFLNSIADLSQGVGMAKDESVDFSKNVVDLGVKLANWGGTNVADTMNDIQSALMGSTKGMEKYGVKLNDATKANAMMKLGLEGTFDELDNATKAQVYYQAILDSSTNAVEYWDEGNRSLSFNLTNIKEMLGNVTENLGNIFLPYVQKAVEKVGDLAKKFSDWTAENPKTLETIVKIAGALALVGPVLLAVGKGIKVFTTVSSVFSAVSTMVTAAGMSLTAFLTPVALVVAGIAALAIAWKNNFMGMKDILSSVFDVIKQVFQTAFTFIKDIFSVFKSAFEGDWKGMWEGIKTLVSNLWDNIISLIGTALNAIVTIILNIGVSLLNAGYEAFNKIKDGALKAWDALKSWIEEVREDPVKAIKVLATSMWNAGADIFNNLWEGCKSVWSNLVGWFEEKINWIKDKLTFWNNSKGEMNSSDSGNSNSRNARVSELPIMGSYAIGNNNILNDGLALLHRGEMVVPKDYNPFNSNRLAKKIASYFSESSGNVTFNNTYNVTNKTDFDAKKFELNIEKGIRKELRKLGRRV